MGRAGRLRGADTGTGDPLEVRQSLVEAEGCGRPISLPATPCAPMIASYRACAVGSSSKSYDAVRSASNAARMVLCPQPTAHRSYDDRTHSGRLGRQLWWSDLS
jgi:hypothetical protein